MEATRGQKHPSEAKKFMKESIYGKKFLMKVAAAEGSNIPPI
jgi:hypothetical protein